MNEPLSYGRLLSALQAPLPGHAAFAALNGYPRGSVEEARRLDPPPRESAILALIFQSQGEVRLLLMRRTTYPGVHSGQIAFPGGKREPDDADLRATALREFEEETGADMSSIRIVGTLSPVYIPPSRIVVTPFVGWSDELGPLEPDTREVDELIMVPLSEVLDDAALQHKEIRISTGVDAMAAYWHLQGQTVWGATALMIAELRAILGKPLAQRG